MDLHQFAAQLLAPMQEPNGISSESMKDMVRSVGNALNDMNGKYEAVKKVAANGEHDGTNEARHCGGGYSSCAPGDDVIYIQIGAGA